MNRALVITSLSLLTLVTGSLAAQSPNLSGTWTIDATKSDPMPAVQAGGPGGPGGRGRGNQNLMVITQTPTEISVVIGAANYIYNLDGSERTGPPGGETKSKIAWEGGKLIVTWKREYFAGPDQGYQTSTGKDTYTLDGNVLIVERTTVLPAQPAQTRKAVYVKAQ